MAKVVLNTVNNPATPSGTNIINQNFTNIATAIEKTLSRDGTLPNQMTADIDLNGNDLLNVNELDADVFKVDGENITDLIDDLDDIRDDVESAAATVIRTAQGITSPDTYNPLNFGLDYLDAGPAINAAIQAAKASGVKKIDFRGSVYTVATRVIIDSVKLENVGFIFSGSNSGIRLINDHPAINNFNIEFGSTFPSGYFDRAVIGLHQSIGASITNGYINGTSRRYAIMCVSQASYTTIQGIEIHCPWGILFDDKNSRVVDGVTATGSIGRGLTIKDCVYYCDPGGTLSGDGLEINCPIGRFSDITIDNYRVNGTVTSASVGIAIGIANCDTVRVTNCVVRNCTSLAGGLHVEWSTDVIFANNTVYDSKCGASIGMCTGVKFIGNWFSNCVQFGIKSQNTAGQATDDMIIHGNTFINGKGDGVDSAFNDIQIGRAHYVTISENRFMGFGETGKTHISFTTFDLIGVEYIVLTDNVFVNTLGFAATSLIGGNTDTKYIKSSGNVWPGYGSVGASFINFVAVRGASTDSHKAGTTEDNFIGGLPLIGGTPAGFITVRQGQLAVDVVNGRIYRGDTTAGNWAQPGAAWSNPIEMGNSYFWNTATQRPRYSSAAPTSDTSGQRIVTQRQVPATATSAGEPGDMAFDASFIYVCYATNTWRRVATVTF